MVLELDPARIHQTAARLVEEHHLPGLSIGVVQGDDLLFCEGFGASDIESGVGMDPNRRQCIASITKTMVGLCVMALVDEGRLSLDDRVVSLLPDVAFHGHAPAITVWHLLTHTGGIGEAPTPEVLTATVNPDQDAHLQPKDFAETYARGIDIEYEPGTKWHYANHGYALLGEIIRRTERAERLHEIFERRIFGPLGMSDSDILGEPHERLTTPYHRAPGEDTRFQLERADVAIPDETAVDGHNIRGRFRGEFNASSLAAGGVQSTIPDMARYASALLRRGAGIVKSETFDAMIAPQYAPDPRLTSWGLSFSRVPRFGGTSIGHGGAYFGGWNSNLCVRFDEGVAVIQHMNVMLDEPAPIFATVIGAVLGVTEPDVTERSVDATVLDRAPGLYELTPGRLTNFRPATRVGRVEVTRDGSALTLRSRWGHWKHGVRLIPASDDDPLHFLIRRDSGFPDRIVFTRGAGGAIDGLRCDELVRMVRAADPL
jgi:CubicO group peptidase (beta-lactamase class C family)